MKLITIPRAHKKGNIEIFNGLTEDMPRLEWCLVSSDGGVDYDPMLHGGDRYKPRDLYEAVRHANKYECEAYQLQGDGSLTSAQIAVLESSEAKAIMQL